mmetsp:Transcript_33183/g.76657  ORF Transcript_33183/g.76657 Transcript_33183/m.76657 type:complete len:374 (+) Transcript_33183:180-1301(+)
MIAIHIQTLLSVFGLGFCQWRHEGASKSDHLIFCDGAVLVCIQRLEGSLWRHRSHSLGKLGNLQRLAGESHVLQYLLLPCFIGDHCCFVSLWFLDVMLLIEGVGPLLALHNIVLVQIQGLEDTLSSGALHRLRKLAQARDKLVMRSNVITIAVERFQRMGGCAVSIWAQAIDQVCHGHMILVGRWGLRLFNLCVDVAWLRLWLVGSRLGLCLRLRCCRLPHRRLGPCWGQATGSLGAGTAATTPKARRFCLGRSCWRGRCHGQRRCRPLPVEKLGLGETIIPLICCEHVIAVFIQALKDEIYLLLLGDRSAHVPKKHPHLIDVYEAVLRLVHFLENVVCGVITGCVCKEVLLELGHVDVTDVALPSLDPAQRD